MAQRTAIGLTGDDLTVDDVWAVAVEGTGAELSDRARERMTAARELVERAAHGSREHTYGVNTGFGRFVILPIAVCLEFAGIWLSWRVTRLEV